MILWERLGKNYWVRGYYECINLIIAINLKFYFNDWVEKPFHRQKKSIKPKIRHKRLLDPSMFNFALLFSRTI